MAESPSPAFTPESEAHPPSATAHIKSSSAKRPTVFEPKTLRLPGQNVRYACGRISHTANPEPPPSMITITDALQVEHALLKNVFAQIESLLPEMASVEEAARHARLVKNLLGRHAEIEDNLVYVTLDHALEEKGKLNHLFEEHREIDFCFDKVATAPGLPEARRLLEKALRASREHFLREEHYVFPIIEKALNPETLVEMGHIWEQNQKAS